jgi:hypothetical protein
MKRLVIGLLSMVVALGMCAGSATTFDGIGIDPSSSFYPLVYRIAWLWSGNESSFVSVVILLELQSALVFFVGLALFFTALREHNKTAAVASGRGTQEQASPHRRTHFWWTVFFALVLADILLANVVEVSFQPVGDCVDCSRPSFPLPMVTFVQTYPLLSATLLIASTLLALVGFYSAWVVKRTESNRWLAQATTFTWMLQILPLIALMVMGMIALVRYPIGQ